MSLFASIVRELTAAGVTGDALVTAIERIEADMEPRVSAGAMRTRRWRQRQEEAAEGSSQSVTVTDGDAQKKKSPTPPKKKTTSSEPNGSSEGALAPIYADSTHELWGEGIPILGSLGVKNPRPIVGRWLKDAKNDAQRVLGAIQRARDARVVDPVPWITRAISTGGNGSGKSGKGSFADALGRLREAEERLRDEGRVFSDGPPPPRLISSG